MTTARKPRLPGRLLFLASLCGIGGCAPTPPPSADEPAAPYPNWSEAETADALHAAQAAIYFDPAPPENRYALALDYTNAVRIEGNRWKIVEAPAYLRADDETVIEGPWFPHAEGAAATSSRASDPVERRLVAQLQSDATVIVVKEGSAMRMAGVVARAPECAACHPGERDVPMGYLLYRLEEIADD
ncbi:MAG: hypothetical protein GC168_17085 [Candidatus Hydrogenedens sp.]|nr:hypothetical protein [Candidatus Hydrogenedens sp.]